MKKLLFTIHPPLLLSLDAGRRELLRPVRSPLAARKGRPGSGSGQPGPRLDLALASCSQQPLGSGNMRWRTGMATAARLSSASLAGERREEALEVHGAGCSDGWRRRAARVDGAWLCRGSHGKLALLGPRAAGESARASKQEGGEWRGQEGRARARFFSIGGATCRARAAQGEPRGVAVLPEVGHDAHAFTDLKGVTILPRKYDWNSKFYHPLSPDTVVIW
jgi:hypothetical protein